MPLLGTFGAGSSRGYGQKGGAPKFIIATGGTETTDGDYRIHTFSSPGTLCISCSGNPLGSDQIEYLVVAGGGGGGGFSPGVGFGGYGGAGGYRQSSGETAGCYPVGNTPTAALAAGVPGIKGLSGPISVTVGGGGSPNSTPGSNSVFGPISSTGGGRGFNSTGGYFPGLPGGGGGQGGGGNAGGYSPPEGFGGGAGNGSQPAAFKGNGYSADGQNTLIQGPFPTTTVGESLNSTRWFSGRGGQHGEDPPGLPVYPGGAGGGGAGTSGGPGQANTGGGGGASGSSVGGGSGPTSGGSGGSGAVILRYKFQ